MDRGSFVYEIETNIFYKDIAEDLEARFDIMRYSIDDYRLPPVKNKNVTAMMKDKLGENHDTVC